MGKKFPVDMAACDAAWSAPVDDEPARVAELKAFNARQAEKAAMRKAAAKPVVEPELTDEQKAVERERRDKERAFEIQRLKAAYAGCVHVKPNGQQIRPDGLLQFVSMHGWAVDKALEAFKHFTEHGWYAVPGHEWGVVPE